MVATAKYGGEAISELNRLLDDETNIDYREYLQKRIDDLKAQQKNKSTEELSPAVHKSDQMISEYFSNLNAMGSYTEIESISNISSKITGITSLLGQSVSWQETATSSELHGRHADVTIEGAFTNTNPLWGTTDPIYSGCSVSVNYITK